MFSIKDGYLCYDGNQPESADEALRRSIEKWIFIAESFDDDESVEDCGGINTCCLCKFHRKGYDCGDCPVAKAGHDGCEGTPYDRFECDAAADTAWDEVDFLKGLGDV